MPERPTWLVVLLLLVPTGTTEFFTGVEQYFTGCVSVQLRIRTDEELGIVGVFLNAEGSQDSRNT